ncbi:MAG: hypothetical protein RL276_1612 [Bacteroidota bacterium]
MTNFYLKLECLFKLLFLQILHNLNKHNNLYKIMDKIMVKWVNQEVIVIIHHNKINFKFQILIINLYSATSSY